MLWPVSTVPFHVYMPRSAQHLGKFDLCLLQLLCSEKFVIRECGSVIEHLSDVCEARHCELKGEGGRVEGIEEVRSQSPLKPPSPLLLTDSGWAEGRHARDGGDTPLFMLLPLPFCLLHHSPQMNLWVFVFAHFRFQMYNLWPTSMEYIPGKHKEALNRLDDVKVFILEKMKEHQVSLDPANPRDCIDCFLSKIEEVRNLGRRPLPFLYLSPHEDAEKQSPIWRSLLQFWY